MSKYLCPYCGKSIFKAVVKEAAAIQLNADGTFKILQEGNKAFEVVECISCHSKVKNEELKAAEIVCKGCKKEYPEKQINKDGLCPVCAAKKANPKLASLTQDQLIMMILQLEAKNKAVQSNSTPQNTDQKSKTEDKKKETKSSSSKKSESKSKSEQKATEKPKETTTADTNPTTVQEQISIPNQNVGIPDIPDINVGMSADPGDVPF